MLYADEWENTLAEGESQPHTIVRSTQTHTYFSSHKCYIRRESGGSYYLPVLHGTDVTGTDIEHISDIVYGVEDTEIGQAEISNQTLTFHVQDYLSDPEGTSTYTFIFPYSE